MAISFVGSLPTVGANNGGDVTLTFSNLRDAAGGTPTLLEGDVVLVAYAASGTADFAMSSLTAGWTNILAEHYSNGTIDTNLCVIGKVMGPTPDTSMVCDGPTGNSNATIGVAIALRGADLTALDVAAVLAAGTGTSVPNPGAITPATAGAWIVVVGAGAAGTGAAYTNPGDLSTTTNHFRSGNHPETNDIAIGIGLKTNWTSGAFDPAAWGGGNVNAANSWAAITLALKESIPAAQCDADDASHGHSVTSPTLAAASSVTVDSSVHAHTADAPTLAANSTTTADSAAHSHTATSPDLEIIIQTDVDDALHAHAATSPTLAAQSSAAVGSSSHAHSATSPVLAAHGTVSVDSSTHGHTATSPDIAIAGSVTVSSVSHAHASESPTLAAKSQVAVNDNLIGHFSTSPTLAANSGVLVDIAVHSHSTTEPDIGVAGQVTVHGSVHAHVSIGPSLIWEISLPPGRIARPEGITLTGHVPASDGGFGIGASRRVVSPARRQL